MIPPTTRSLPVAALALASCAAAANAQEWINTAPGNWNNPLFWSTGVVPDGVGATALLRSDVQGGLLSMDGIFTVATPVTLGSLNIEMGVGGPDIVFLLQGLVLDNGAGADVFLDVSSTTDVQMACPVEIKGDLIMKWGATDGRFTGNISGDFGVVHEPLATSHRLRLWGANTYTGETIVRNGILSIRDSDGLGDHSAGTTIDTGGRLQLDNSQVITVTGEIVTLQNGGALRFRGADWAEQIRLVNEGQISPLFDNTTATVSGQLTGDGVFIRASAGSGGPTFESILNVTNTANDYSQGTILHSGVLRIPGDAVLGAPGAPITFETTGFSEGPPSLLTTADTTIARPITLTSNGWLRAEPATTARYTQKISGDADLAIGFNAWTGAVALEAANDYTGATTVIAGTLIAANTTGSATGAGPVAVESGAALAGDGAISAAVSILDGATIAPGESAGSLALGDLSLAPAAALHIELGGVNPGESDRIDITGPNTVALDGDLTVNLLPEYTPENGNEFIILAAAAVTGAFASETLPEGMEIEYAPTEVIIRAISVPQPCPTDLTGDGTTNGADLGQLLGSWGPGGGPADFTDDGVVNGADLAQMLGSWGPCP
ncbi:MAG: autotransporter-associated beta strand repeat-containing protein [Planctomycetota bacterium]|nr:autotransporter-associated beta strand repeat-containing protein [Planctomycetota bacterium]